MKNKSKTKLWFATSLPLAALVGGLPLALVGCSCKDKVPENIKQRRYVKSWNSTYTSQAFLNDISASYGSFQATATYQETGGLLFRKQGLNEPEVVNGNKIKKPSFSKYRLELAKQVVLTMKDGTTKVYDNDKAEIQPSADLSDGTYSKISVQSTSNDPRSINNLQFLEDLKNAKRVQVTVKEDTHWTNHEGQKTKYKISARDFYYSWLRTVGLTTETRHDLGGTKKLDDIANTYLCEPNSAYFTKNTSYNNEYLYRVFNVNSDNFYDESKFVTEVNGVAGVENGTKAVTFDLLDDTKESQFDTFFKKSIIGSYEMSAAPSQYIDDMNQNSSYTAYNVLNKDNTSEIKDELEKIKGKKAYQAGLYWYGISTKNTLYSGPYYAKTRKDYDRILKANPNYWDKEWVNRKDKIEEIIWRYSSTASTDANIFNEAEYKKYLLGEVTTIPYSQLTDTQKATIIKNKEKLGLKYTKLFNASSPTYRFLTVPYVRSQRKADGTTNETSYLFNDAYAKLMWGSTTKELAEGKGNIENYASGFGLTMRTLLNAAVNWNYFEDLATNGTQRPWLAKFAEHGSMGGKDQDSNPKTPIDYYDQVNTLLALDKDGKKVDSASVSPKENRDWINQTSETDEKLKSAKFAEIKQLVKDTLDKFESLNPEYKGKKYEYTSYYQWGNLDQLTKRAREKLEKLFKELDSRLDIKCENTDNTQNETFNAARDNGTAGMEFAGWNYDFDSSASGFDGLSWSNQLFPLLSYLGSQKPENVKKAFPKLSQLAEELVNYSMINYKGTIPFNELYKIKSSLMYTFTRGGYEYKWTKNSDGKYELYRNAQGKLEKDPNATDIYEFSAIFWLNYFKTKLTNDEIAELMKELTSYMSTYSESGLNATPKEEFSPYLINKHYQQPLVSGLPPFHGDVTVNVPEDKK